jgi:tetratricopeptide (TPR) repeat protein
MATKKTKSSPAKTAAQADAYQSALKEFGNASRLLQKGDYAKAKAAFQAIAAGNPEERELVQRAETYVTICDNRMAPPAGEPCTADDWYYQGVVSSNQGNHDEAIRCLGKALKQEPTSPKYLFARASAFGKQGNAQLAVADLRQAVLGDPAVRFQAVNDSDFEPIRDDAGFIDLIEPTPAEG